MNAFFVKMQMASNKSYEIEIKKLPTLKVESFLEMQSFFRQDLILKTRRFQKQGLSPLEVSAVLATDFVEGLCHLIKAAVFCRIHQSCEDIATIKNGVF